MDIDNELDTFGSAKSHPVERDQYTLSTKPIGEVINKIRTWSRRKIRGAIITGRPRLGKSRAIKFVRSNVSKIFSKNVANFIFDCEKTLVNNEGGFMSDLLSDLGYGLPLEGTPLKKRHRVYEFLVSEAQRYNDHRVILFIDEAQNLTPQQYDWLIGIYNQLEKADVQLYAFLFGQEELIAQKSAYKVEGRTQIIGRFMVGVHRFRGLRTKDDFRYALARYDSHSEYPIGSGTPFTKYYFEDAYNHGWRLADLTDVIWNAFMDARTESNIHSKIDIPMQAFTAVVDGILLTCGSRTSRRPQVGVDVISQLLRESSYVDLEQSVAA